MNDICISPLPLLLLLSPYEIGLPRGPEVEGVLPPPFPPPPPPDKEVKALVTLLAGEVLRTLIVLPVP